MKNNTNRQSEFTNYSTTLKRQILLMDSNNETGTTETRTDRDESRTDTPTTGTHQQQSQQRTIIDEVTEQASRRPKRTLALISGAISPFLTWISVSFMGGSIASIGVDSWVGKLYLLLVIGIAIVEFGPDLGVRTKEAWFYGGAGMILLSAGFAVYSTYRISQMNSELGLFSGAVDASLGWGVYLAIGVGLLATYLGTQMTGTVRGYTVD